MSEPKSASSAEPPPEPTTKADTRMQGPLAWMARNSVAANLIMLFLLVTGLLMMFRVKQEVFPEFELDLVLINVPYPGASPAEVEQGVVLAVEEAIQGVDDIQEVRSYASEGVAVVAVELRASANKDRALADIKSAVDRITSFPEDIERPVVSLAESRRQVLSLVVYGDKSERDLRVLAEQTRDDLLADPDVSYAELAGVRSYEISVEVPQASLRDHDLTIDQIAARIRQASVEVPGGGVESPGGEVLLRTTERRRTGDEFGDIVLTSDAEGSEVRVRDIANVVDGFTETDQEADFDGHPAALVQVYRVGDEGPIEVSDAVHRFVEESENRLPPGVSYAIWSDSSEIYRDRMNLLLRNMTIGLVLVLFTLGLFLEVRLAFWVTMGIPVSFLATFLFMPMIDVSLNMISLFAFIVTLGMVVDDAIVIGEAVYKHRQDGLGWLPAAIAGVREVAGPVVFAILTTCIAFAPMLFVPGISGKFFRVIPAVVIIVLLVSLFESILVLPAHLAHPSPRLGRLLAFIDRPQQRFSRAFERFIANYYVPALRWASRHRYLVLAACVGLFIGVTGLTAGGRLAFTFLPKIESDVVAAEITMPFGTSVEETRRVRERVERALEDVVSEYGDRHRYLRGVYAETGSTSTRGFGASTTAGSHLAQVSVYLVPIDRRPFSGAELTRRWRERIGSVPGIESLTFQFSTGPSDGSPIDIELSHTDLPTLESAAERLAGSIRTYSGVEDIDDGFGQGKEQLDFRIRPEARALGLSELDVARQVRSAFFGAEAVRQQRGRDEVRTYVRRPLAERTSLYDVEQLMIRTPRGGELPLAQAAEIVRGRAYTQIQRVDQRRIVRVTGDVARGTNATEVVGDIEKNVLPRLLSDFPGLRYRLTGEQKSQAETLDALGTGAIIAIIAMFGLLAAAFRSYIQPVIIMSAIPFGLIGAYLGHVLMGYDLSLMSVMGIVALSGVAVNDSLVLVDAANRYRAEGLEPAEAIAAAGGRRFRAILLTSLTTFLGLAPMITETSVQARFLIPMAISLGFGVLFATIITLFLVPSLYLIVEDAKRIVVRTPARGAHAADVESAPPAE